MFFAQNEYGTAVLSRIFSTLPIDSSKRLSTVARFLGVTESTLQRWLTGKSEPPRAVCYALWHESHEGRAYADNHLQNNMTTLRGLARSQGEAIAALESTVDRLRVELSEAKQKAAAPLPANDPDYGTRRIAAHLRPRADALR